MIDLNVILDYAEKRQPYYRYSSIVISQVLKGKCAGMVPAHALTTINYLVTKHANQQRPNEFVGRYIPREDVDTPSA